ncbi:MAG: AzlC family ABC transporter permease [Succinivibrio sp.]
MKHAIPVCLGYLSVGLAYAVLAKQQGFSELQIILMSMVCYSGSGQFLAVVYGGNNASLLAITIGLLLLNFRYFIMSTCVFVRFKVLSNLKRIIFSHFITDEPFAIFTTAKKELVSVSYFSGLVFPSWLSWILGAVLGVAASGFFPQNLVNAMNIALYALFIAIVAPASTKDFRLLVIVVCAAVLNMLLSLVFTGENSCWAILVTIIVCSFIGAFFTKDSKKDSEVNSETSKEKV